MVTKRYVDLYGYGRIIWASHYNVKQKLTIGLSKEVIEKAKAARINISAITEQILRAYTYEPSGYTKDDLIEAYGEFFKSIQPVLDKYAAGVKVGQHTNFSEDGMDGSFPLLLTDRGKLLIWSLI